MQLNKVTYARTFNLGNYENERIEVSADVQPGETYDGVLSSLKAMVQPCDRPEPPPAATVFHLALHNYAGTVMTVYQTEYDWLKAYDAGLAQTRDVRGYEQHNRRVFQHIRARAQSKDNPRALNLVLEVERRQAGMLQ